MKGQEELIEQYLTGQLSREDASFFEERLKDSARLREALRQESSLIEGLQNARRLELKAMLSNASVGGGWSSASVQAGLATLSVGLVGLILALSTRSHNPAAPTTLSRAQKGLLPEHVARHTPAHTGALETQREDAAEDHTHAEQRNDVAVANSSVKTNAQLQPFMPPTPPMEGMDAPEIPREAAQEAFDKRTIAEPRRLDMATTSIEVELREPTGDRRFHYQFEGKKLILYGAFTVNMYELLPSEKSDTELYMRYHGSYYCLEKTVTEPAPLVRIADHTLIEQLEAYSNR